MWVTRSTSNINQCISRSILIAQFAITNLSSSNIAILPSIARTLEMGHVALATLTRLDQLIESLLDVARLDQGLFVLHLQPLNLVALLHETAPAFSTRETHIQIEGPEEVILSADSDRLRQVLENVLANAVKHAPQQTEVLVSVNSEQRDDGAWVNVSVHNQGPAIPADLVAHLFQPFVAGSSSQGLGLGLYLARSIAQAHHGHLTVASEGTSGTEFTLSLPTEQERPENTDPLPLLKSA